MLDFEKILMAAVASCIFLVFVRRGRARPTASVHLSGPVGRLGPAKLAATIFITSSATRNKNSTIVAKKIPADVSSLCTVPLKLCTTDLFLEISLSPLEYNLH